MLKQYMNFLPVYFKNESIYKASPTITEALTPKSGKVELLPDVSLRDPLLSSFKQVNHHRDIQSQSCKKLTSLAYQKLITSGMSIRYENSIHVFRWRSCNTRSSVLMSRAATALSASCTRPDLEISSSASQLTGRS